METVEDVKVFLESYNCLMLQVKSLKKQCDDYAKLITETGGVRGISQDGMPHGNGKSDPVAEVVLNAEKMRIRYSEKLNDKLMAAEKIERMLDALEDDEQFILRSVYMDKMGIHRVAQDCHTSEATIYRKKDLALKKILKNSKVDSP